MEVIEKKGTLPIVAEPIGSVESGVMSLYTFTGQQLSAFYLGLVALSHASCCICKYLRVA
jgi:hypothetical protein